MIQFECMTRLPSVLREADLLRIAEVVSRGLRIRRPTEIAVRFVSLREMQQLNKRFRGKNRPTDVLSFNAASDLPAERGTKHGIPLVLGDLVICPAYAKLEAKRRSIEWHEELVRLFIHGVLHLSGYDHQTEQEEARMFARQEAWVEAVNL